MGLLGNAKAPQPAGLCSKDCKTAKALLAWQNVDEECLYWLKMQFLQHRGSMVHRAWQPDTSRCHTITVSSILN